jgi:hypothetical protein
MTIACLLTNTVRATCALARLPAAGVTAEKKFWRCVQFGDTPRLFGVEPPRPRIEAVRSVDMASSNAWAEFAAQFCSTRTAFLEHERAKTELKGLDAGGCQGGLRP